MRGKGLSGNQLKLIAMLCMTLDHIGVMLLPESIVLRAIGRLALPVYAYMIAEGCRHTRSMGRYLSVLLLTAAVCQGVYFFAMQSVYMCIMVTFSLSVILIWLLQQANNGWWAKLALGAGIVLAFFAAEVLPQWLKGTDYGIDYGFVGIALPVGIYLLPDRKRQLLYMGACLLLLSIDWDVQLWSLLALPLLALYNGKRGTWKLKWLFYLYYPAHLGGIWLIGQMIDKLQPLG